MCIRDRSIPYYGVKEAVFPFNMFPEVDPLLGPEMRSTGEVLGLSTYYGEAFYKAQEATQTSLPLSGTVLISVNRKDKDEVVEIGKLFHECGFKILATESTCRLINEAGIPAERVNKLQDCLLYTSTKWCHSCPCLKQSAKLTSAQMNQTGKFFKR